MALDIGTYMNQKATPWVSAVVLCGCVMITIVFVYSAIQAQVLGGRFADTSYEISASN